MGNILDFLKNIKSARFGAEVRDSIHDAIQQCYYDGKAGSVDLEARQKLETKASQEDLVSMIAEEKGTFLAEKANLC